MTTIDDDAALSLALSQITSDRTHHMHAQILEKLACEPRDRVALFAVYSQQMDNLGLKPWQSPPSWIDDADAIIAFGSEHADYHIARLVKQMDELGISKYHPDPATAIAAAKEGP